MPLFGGIASSLIPVELYNGPVTVPGTFPQTSAALLPPDALSSPRQGTTPTAVPGVTVGPVPGTGPVVNVPRTSTATSRTALYYDVSTHAYGRPNHAVDEADVRFRVSQVVEWWYNPSNPNGNELFAGLAGNAPTAMVFYNATRSIVNDLFFEPNIVTARDYIRKRATQC